MHPLTLRAASALAAVALASSSLAAQAASRPTFGVAGGLAAPIGDFGDGFKSGYDIAAFLGFRPSASPVGFRIEGAYNQFDAERVSDVSTKIVGGTGNIVLGTPGAPGSIRPYVVAGLGIYNVKFGSASDTKFGLNGGAGLDLPLSGISAFIEARLNYVFTDNGSAVGGGNTSFIPVVVGVRF